MLSFPLPLMLLLLLLSLLYGVYHCFRTALNVICFHFNLHLSHPLMPRPSLTICRTFFLTLVNILIVLRCSLFCWHENRVFIVVITVVDVVFYPSNPCCCSYFVVDAVVILAVVAMQNYLH